jgi:hypothetical protein
MANEPSAEEIFTRLSSFAIHLWGEEDAARQRPALQQTAEYIAVMQGYVLPPDLEPRFF